MWMPYIIGDLALVTGLYLLARKMELRLNWALPWAATIAPLCLWLASRLCPLLPGLSLVFQFVLATFLAVGASVLVILALFFRDPKRVPPSDAWAILSPADGKIVYIKTLKDGRFPIAVKKGKEIPLTEFIGEAFPLDDGFQIGIMMSYLDVHINRAPIAGDMERVKRIPGAFHSLKHMDSLLENERVFSIIRGLETRIGMVQIASRVVRRIITFVKEGDAVLQGGRIGMIRFGSQVDLLIPSRPDLSIVIRVGDYVKAGISVIARYDDQGTAKPKG